MKTYVEKLILGAGSVFKGHIESARHVGSLGILQEGFIVTFKASEWKKGSGRALASFLFIPWCSGPCSIQDNIDALVRHDEERIYIIGDRQRPSVYKMSSDPVPLDGFTGDCELVLSKLPIGAERHEQPYFGQFLYELALAAEIEKLPSTFPQKSGGEPAEPP